MKLSFTLMTAALLMGTAAYGQITIHDADFSPIGYSYTWSAVGGVAFSVGNAGEDQIWTFEDYAWVSTEQRTFENPSAGPHGNEYPDATRVEHIVSNVAGFTDNFAYQQITPTAYTLLGQTAGDSLVGFNSPTLQMPLPNTYGSQWHSVVYYETTIFDTFRLFYRDSLTSVVDGWGTVNTPYGSWPALRVFMHHWINMGYVEFPDSNFTTEMVGYSWVNQEGNPVVAVASEQEGADPNFSTGSISMMGASPSTAPRRHATAGLFTVEPNYPNPFNPSTVLPVTLTQPSPVRLDIFNALGQLVHHEEQLMPAGTHPLKVDGSQWVSGLYFAKVSAGRDQRVIRMTLVK